MKKELKEMIERNLIKMNEELMEAPFENRQGLVDDISNLGKLLNDAEKIEADDRKIEADQIAKMNEYDVSERRIELDWEKLAREIDAEMQKVRAEKISNIIEGLFKFGCGVLTIGAYSKWMYDHDQFEKDDIPRYSSTKEIFRSLPKPKLPW